MIKTTTTYFRSFGLTLLLFFSLQTTTSTLFAQEYNARVVGLVTDQDTGEALPGATVQIANSSYGAVTDIYGRYDLPVPAGSVQLEVRFLGYTIIRETVELGEGETITQDFIMEPDAFLGEEVVITGQLLGQQAAINQQINSNTIVNVVSKDKIRELPDQNAAESVGRLSGIAIQRDGGEGQKVVVRGLSPRFNNITINGERIPSTDPQDRSVDLSFIAPEQLEGIEVFKALRPDMDADAIGGQINFIARKASEKTFELRASGGYNQISDRFGQPRINVSGSDRFLENKLGVILTGNYQRVDRDTEIVQGGYGSSAFTQGGTLGLTSASVTDRNEERVRYGASATLDYKLSENHTFQFTSNYGATDRFIENARRQVGVESERAEFRMSEQEVNISVLSNTLSGQHLMGSGWSIDWLSSFSTTRQETPLRRELRFELNGGFVRPDDPNIPLDQALSIQPVPPDSAFIDRNGVRSLTTNTEEDVYTARIDVKKALKIGEVSGFIKFGGKVRLFDRVNSAREFRDTGPGNLNLILDANEQDPENPFAPILSDDYVLNSTERPLLLNFLESRTSDEFLGGEYEFGPTLSFDELRSFFSNWGDQVLAERFVLSAGNSNAPYEARELISAGYVMTELNYRKFMIMGGVRAERADNEYTGFEFVQGSDDELVEGEEVNFTVIERVNEVWYANLFPMIHARYKFTDWLDLRVAYTETISRPDYRNWTPWINYSPSENTLRRGNPFLQPTLATNYDIFVSTYNKFGLFTVGLFYKELRNIDVESTSILPPVGVRFPSATVNEPINISDVSTIEGIEIDFQANTLVLPSPFNRLVFSANATFITSSTLYPFLNVDTEAAEAPLFNPESEAILREGSVPGQPDFTANLSIGYEDQKFSIRISTILQDQTFDELGARAEDDQFTGFSDRWDLTASYRITDNLTVFSNANNFTNEPIQNFQAGNLNFLTEQEEYGATFDLGIKYKIK